MPASHAWIQKHYIDLSLPDLLSVQRTFDRDVSVCIYYFVRQMKDCAAGIYFVDSSEYGRFPVEAVSLLDVAKLAIFAAIPYD